MADHELTVHPLAQLFPEMSEAEYSTLVEDIKEHGLHEAIVLADNQILDGRDRFRACLATRVEPRFVAAALRMSSTPDEHADSLTPRSDGQR